MENASKALLMAGGVLIGLLILSLAVYLFTTFGAESKRVHIQIEQNQLTQYNAQYTVFAGKKDITIHEIISVANLAKEHNEYYKTYGDFTTAYEVKVELTGVGTDSTNSLQSETQEDLQKLLEKYNTIGSDGELETTFSCSTNATDIKYHSNGRVSYIKFTKTL